MSKLRSRLERLERKPQPTAGRSSPPSPALRRRLDHILGADRAVAGAASSPPPSPPEGLPFPPDVGPAPGSGRPTSPSSGATRTVWRFPTDHRHGRMSVDGLARSVATGSRELFPEFLGGVEELHQIAFLDTETTGLAGGAGTIPFLVGIGRWRPDSAGGFHVVQLFLEELHREDALLRQLAAELAGVRCLVTYNGAAYDLPLLQNRHVLCREPWPLTGIAHLDLLPPARTLWASGHPDCRLGTLEAALLGFERHGDVPGAEIPGLYRAFLSGATDPRFTAVFRHNRDDILSLAGLLAAAGDAAHAPAGEEALGVALLHTRRGRAGPARPALEAALGTDLPRSRRYRALKELSLAHKRAGRWTEALKLWCEMRSLDPGDPYPVVEAAKALEHHLEDPAAALTVVAEALAAGRWIPRDREELEHRRRRLQRRAGAS